MKRLLSTILIAYLIAFFAVNGWAATTFTDTATDHKWSTVANWSDGKPDSADAVTVHADVTSLIIDEAASALSFDTTAATGAVTISGTGALTVSGNFTLEAGGSWTNTGILSFSTNAAAINTAGISLGTAASVRILGGCDATLAAAINTGTKALYIYGAGSSLDTGNFQIDSGTFGDNATAGAVTLTPGTSTINCSNVSFSAATLTVTANTAPINLTTTVGAGGSLNTYFGGKTWGGTISIINNSILVLLRDANTFGHLSVTQLVGGSLVYETSFVVRANTTVTGTLTLVGTAGIVRPMIRTWAGDGQKTITAGAIAISGAMDFMDIAAAGAVAPWDLSAIPSGNLGGNSNITFRTPHTYYAYCGTTDSRQDYMDVWSATDDGENRAAGGTTVFPLPQDTIIFDNYSWDDTGNTFLFHAGGRQGNVDASGVTEANTIALPRNLYGDVTYTGSGINVATPYSMVVDARLKNEGTDTLDINITPAVGASPIGILSWGGSPRLISGLTTTGSFTLTRGTFDLNGQILTSGTFLSTNSNARTLQDSAGGGKIILNGLTGTIYDTTTATNLTVSNAPDIDIGDSNNTLTGNVTFIGSGKTYGDLSVKKHAGNYSTIIAGANTFGVISLETPDATYQYSDVQFPVATNTTCTSFAADGTATYTINVVGDLVDTAGTNTVNYCTITNSDASGGATWTAKHSTDGTGNTGWVFASGSGGIFGFGFTWGF